MEQPKDISFENQSPKVEVNPSIEAETLFDFEEWGLRGKWLRLSTPDGKTVEGAYYQANKSNNEVIIFHPGLPGDTVVRFEEDAVGALLDQGYDVFVARHNGLKSQEDNENLFHNKTRVEKSDGIPGESLDWFSEPQVSISYFAQQEKPITLITHSFGGTAGANSFVEMAKNGVDSSPAQKVKKWVIASAPIWGVKDEGMLDPERNLDVEDLRNICKYFSQKYEMPEDGGSEKFVEKTLETLHTIDSKIGSSMPNNTEVVGIYAESDKIVSPEVGVGFFNKLPRGVLLRDKYVPQDENEDGHELKHAKIEDLLRMIKMHTSKSKHTVNINQ